MLCCCPAHVPAAQAWAAQGFHWVRHIPAPPQALLAPGHGDGAVPRNLAASGVLMCTLRKYVFPVEIRAFPAFAVQPCFLCLTVTRSTLALPAARQAIKMKLLPPLLCVLLPAVVEHNCTDAQQIQARVRTHKKNPHAPGETSEASYENSDKFTNVLGKESGVS